MPVNCDTIQKYGSFAWETTIEPAATAATVNAGSRPVEAINETESEDAVMIAAVDEPLSILNIDDIKKGIRSPAPVKARNSDALLTIDVDFNTAPNAPPAPATISMLMERSILSVTHPVKVVPRSFL